MEVSRNNHYIPQLYLRKWATNNKIYVHRLLVPHEKYPTWEKRSVRQTAYIENLYVRIEDGAEYDDFEVDFNRQFETPVKPVLDKICLDQKLTPADWRILCDYITAQYVRTPSFYLFVATWGKKEVPKTLESILDEITTTPKVVFSSHNSIDDRNLLPMEFRVSNLPDDNSINIEVATVVGKNLWLSIIYGILSFESPIKKEFRSMKWSIITAPPEMTWPTCDTPVIITKRDPKGMLSLAKGIGYKDRVILFPVSPKKLLLATHKRIFAWEFGADTTLAQQIKAAIVENALMYVYSSSEDASVIAARNRVVDEVEFKSYQTLYSNWFDAYKRDEAPLLTSGKNIKEIPVTNNQKEASK